MKRTANQAMIIAKMASTTSTMKWGFFFPLDGGSGEAETLVELVDPSISKMSGAEQVCVHESSFSPSDVRGFDAGGTAQRPSGQLLESSDGNELLLGLAGLVSRLGRCHTFGKVGSQLGLGIVGELGLGR